MSNTFNPGDILIESGIAHQIKKLKEQTTLEGETEPYLIYEPVFKKSATSATISCSIPVSSLNQTNIRKPLTKTEIDTLLAGLTTKPQKPYDIDSSKEAFKANSLPQIAQTVKRLWLEHHQKDQKLPISKKNVLDHGLKCLTQEVAVVFDLKPTQAMQKIHTLLDQMTVSEAHS